MYMLNVYNLYCSSDYWLEFRNGRKAICNAYAV